jgi:hypothetical protein
MLEMARGGFDARPARIGSVAARLATLPAMLLASVRGAPAGAQPAEPMCRLARRTRASRPRARTVRAERRRHGAQSGFFGIALVDHLDSARLPQLARETREAGVRTVPTQALLESWTDTTSPEALADVANAARIAGVLVHGRWLSRAELDRRLAALANP